MNTITNYRISKYSEQTSTSPGVRAGMWVVIEIVERDFAFADTEAGALAIFNALTKAK
jgi:hypothetical protein